MHEDVEVDKQVIREIDAIEAAIQGREVTTEADEADAVKMIQIIKDRKKTLETSRKAHTKPLNDRKRAIDKLFRPYTKKLNDMEIELKAKVVRSQQARAEANRLAMQAAQQAAQSGAPTVSQHLDAIDDRPLPQHTSMRRFWQFEVTDPSKLPGQFWSPDPEKIKAELAKHTDFDRPPNIPGVKITVGGSLTVRQAKK